MSHWRWEEGWKIYEVALEPASRAARIAWSACENPDVTEGRAPFAATARQTAAEFMRDGPWPEALHDCGWSDLRPACVGLIEALDEDVPPWLAALDLQHTGALDAARRQVAAGASPDLLVGGRDALFYACWLGFVDVGRWLIELGVPLDRTYPLNFGDRRTALHLAISTALVEEGRIFPLVDALLAAGAAVDGRTERGETALHLVLAATPWRPRLAQRLVDGGADVNARTLADLPYVYEWLAAGWTPLMSLFNADLKPADRRTRLRWLVERGALLDGLDAKRQAEVKRTSAT